MCSSDLHKDRGREREPSHHHRRDLCNNNCFCFVLELHEKLARHYEDHTRREGPFRVLQQCDGKWNPCRAQTTGLALDVKHTTMQ